MIDGEDVTGYLQRVKDALDYIETYPG